MLPNALKMSMEQYLRLVDHDIERRLMGLVSGYKERFELRMAMAAEKIRLSDYNMYKRQFADDFRLTITPAVAYSPCIGHHLSCRVTVEGAAERAHNALAEKRKYKISAHGKFLFKLGSTFWPKPVIHVTGI